MPLSPTDIFSGRGVRASHVKQFFDLLTGLMTDQTVVLKNTLTVGGNQAVNGHLLTLQGVADMQDATRYVRLLNSAGAEIWAIDKNGQQVYSGPLSFSFIDPPGAPLAGLSLYARGTGRLYTHPLDGVEDEIALLSAAQALSNKTLGDGKLTSKQVAKPAAPPAGHQVLYCKVDGKWYTEKSDGNESTVGENPVSALSNTVPDGVKSAFLIGTGIPSVKCDVFVNGLFRDVGVDYSFVSGEDHVDFDKGWVPGAGDRVKMKYVAA
jgi:hypothetical protein